MRPAHKGDMNMHSFSAHEFVIQELKWYCKWSWLCLKNHLNFFDVSFAVHSTDFCPVHSWGLSDLTGMICCVQMPNVIQPSKMLNPSPSKPELWGKSFSLNTRLCHGFYHQTTVFSPTLVWNKSKNIEISPLCRLLLNMALSCLKKKKTFQKCPCVSHAKIYLFTEYWCGSLIDLKSIRAGV